VITITAERGAVRMRAITRDGKAPAHPLTCRSPDPIIEEQPCRSNRL
jgi:hypothetical protein